MSSFQVQQARFYHRPDAPAHEAGCQYDVPSVTTILNVLAKPALLPWGVKLVAEAAARERWAEDQPMFVDRDEWVQHLKRIPAETRDTAADLGILVHACADAMARGEPLPPLPDGVSQGQVEAYVEQFEAWRKGYGPMFLMTEVEVHNVAEGYAGRFDSIVQMPDGEMLLCDLKTGRAVYDAVALQLAAYGHADEWDTARQWLPLVFDGYAVLHLRPDSYRFLRINVTESDFQAFLAAKRLWEWQREVKERQWVEIALPTEVVA